MTPTTVPDTSVPGGTAYPSRRNEAEAHLRLIGRDWALVYQTPQTAPCLVCGRDTLLLVSFKPGTTLRICGGCRGY